MMDGPLIDPREAGELDARWGVPTREEVSLLVEPEMWVAWGARWPGQHREVLFLLPRPGGLLLHRKAHYPRAGWRLLTGSMERGERVEAALQREVAEETGLRVLPRRYVAELRYSLQCEGEPFRAVTHIFLMAYSDAPLAPSHDGEIEATRTVPLGELPAIADQLERLATPWRAWGRFRALAHHLVARAVSEEEVRP